MDYKSILSNHLAGKSPGTVKKQPGKKQEKKETIPPGKNRKVVIPAGDDKDEHEPPPTLNEKKTKEEIRKLQIANESALRNLVDKQLVQSILGEVGQSIQSNFIDQAKRNAGNWASQLSIPERERDIEKLISDMVESGVNGVVADLGRLCSDGVFEG